MWNRLDVRLKFPSRFWLGLILLTALALRLYRLGVESLWYDETVSVFLAQQDLVTLTRHTAGDIHPPLYYYLLHFWGALAGWSEFAMAFVSLFFGVLLIALTYRVACAWFDHRIALIAAFLVAISPYNLWYAQEVRMYTLGATLGLASTYFFVRLLKQFQPRLVSRDLIAYAVISALGLYTLYYFAFLLVFQNLVAAIQWVRQTRQRRLNFEFRTWFVSQLATPILFAPWLPTALRQAFDPPVPPWRTFTDWSTVIVEAFTALTLGQSVEPGIVAPILIGVVVVLGIAFWQNRERSKLVFLLGYTLVPLTIIVGLSLWKPLYHVRYVFLYAPAFYILLAIGLATLRRVRFVFPVMLTVLTLASAYSISNFWFDPRYADDDLRGATQYLAAHWRPGDAVLIDAGYTYTAFVYYFDQPIAWRGRLTNYPPRDMSLGSVQRLVDQHRAPIVLQTGSIGGAPNLGWGNPESDFYATTADETRAALDQVFAFHSRVWLFRVYDTVVDPDGVIRDYLAQHGRIFDDAGFAGQAYARVQGYLTSRAPQMLPANLTRRDVLLDNRIALAGFTPASATARPGDFLDVDTYWRTQEPTNVDARLFVGLYADKTLVASTDELPVGNALGTSRWSPGDIWRAPVRLRLPPHLAPGEYVVRVALYNPLTNESLSVPKSEWTNENNQITLTTVQVP